jgi:KaiC/GvpD/RAD55 family RecA-like ATPase
MAETIRAEDVQPEEVRWLWPRVDGVEGRIAEGTLSTFAGRPDQGKGLMAAHIASVVSREGNSRGHKNVLYSAMEDSHGLMTRPRLEAAGADLRNILLWRFQIPSQLRELEAIIRQKQIALVVMDPFAAHLSRGVSRHSDNIREVLNPLTSLIEETGTSILVVEHALKRIPASSHPLAAIGGSSSGLVAACRSAFLFGIDPADDDGRYLCTVKMNLRQWYRTEALRFELDAEDIENVGSVPALIYDDECNMDAMRLLDSHAGHGKVGRPPDKRAAAAEWLTTYLFNAGQPVPAGKVFEDAKQFRMTSKTLRRASEDMGVVKNPPGGGRSCKWSLPQEIIDLLTGADEEQIEEKGEQIAQTLSTSDDAVQEAEEAGMEVLTDEDVAALLGGALDDDESDNEKEGEGDDDE